MAVLLYESVASVCSAWCIGCK